MQNEIQLVDELGQWANTLAKSANLQSENLREAQERLTEVVVGMSKLAEKAAEAATGFHHKLVVVKGNLQPSVHMIAITIGILKRIKEVSRTVEDTVQFQAAAAGELAMAVGEAVGEGARITTQIVTLAEAIKSVLPVAGNRSKGEAELASLTADLHDFVAHLRDGRGNTGTSVPDASTSQLQGESSAIN